MADLGGFKAVVVRDGRVVEELEQKRTENEVLRRGKGRDWKRVPTPVERRTAEELAKGKAWALLQDFLVRADNEWLEEELMTRLPPNLVRWIRWRRGKRTVDREVDLDAGTDLGEGRTGDGDQQKGV